MRLVHRDIKPSNIRIGRHGEVKLLDFGIARSDEVVREAKTAAQMVVGSLQYMAPERFSDRPLGPEADVFALGCCLFEGLSGQLLFARIDPARALRLALDPEQYTKHLYRRRRALRKDTDIGIIALIEHCLAYAPEDRPTAAELVECCDVLSGELPGQTVRSWARARDWPDVSEAEGPLTGRSFTETLTENNNQGHGSALASGSRKVAMPPETAAFPTPNRPFKPAIPTSDLAHRLPVAAPAHEVSTGGYFNGRMAMVGVLLLLLAGVATVGGAVVMGSAMYVSGAEEVEEGAVDEPMEATPREEAPVDEAPGPIESAPQKPSPTLRERVGKFPVVTPAPATGSPEEDEATPVPEAPGWDPPGPAPVLKRGMGTVRVNGEQRVTLRANGVVHKLGQVPAGRYVVYVDFGAGAKRSMTVDLVAGEVLTMKCNTLLSDCIYD